MKKRNLFILFSFIYLLFVNILSVNADSLGCAFGLEEGSSTYLKSGDIISIDLGFDNYSSNQQIRQVTYSLTFFNDDFEIVYQDENPIKTYYDWTIDDYYTDGTGYAVRSVIFTISTSKKYFITNKDLNLEIANIKLRAKNNLVRKQSVIKINGNKTDYYLNEDYHLQKCSNTQKIIVNFENVFSDKSLYLEDIEINNGMLSIYNTEGKKGYDKNYKDYTILVSENTESINVKAICSKDNCKINGDGNLKLSKRNNYFQISIENNNVFEYYYLNVIKVKNCDDNTFLCYEEQLKTFQNYTCPQCNNSPNLLSKYFEIKDNENKCSEEIRYIEVCNNKNNQEVCNNEKNDLKIFGIHLNLIFKIIVLFCVILLVLNIIQFIKIKEKNK